VGFLAHLDTSGDAPGGDVKPQVVEKYDGRSICLADALVLDVKFGSGAFMQKVEDAERLARSLVDTGKAMGKRIIALLTDMDEPLGRMVGNFLEVEESLDCLEGKGPEDLMEVTLELAARMAALGGMAAGPEEGRRLCEESLAGGRPRQFFLDNIQSQGGNVKQFLELRGNYRSEYRGEVRAKQPGYITRINAGQTGRAGVLLGVGRNRTGDSVSPTAGIQLHRKRGDPVVAGDLIMTVWARDAEGLNTSLPLLAEAVEYGRTAPAPRSLVLKEII
jgi:pyrimidine-nucleoside phosphorylase